MVYCVVVASRAFIQTKDAGKNANLIYSGICATEATDKVIIKFASKRHLLLSPWEAGRLVRRFVFDVLLRLAICV